MFKFNVLVNLALYARCLTIVFSLSDNASAGAEVSQGLSIHLEGISRRLIEDGADSQYVDSLFKDFRFNLIPDLLNLNLRQLVRS